MMRKNFNMNLCIKVVKLFFLCELSWTLVKADEKNSDNICQSQECKHTAEIFKKNMNTAVLPCQNFYEFMCGNYKQWNPLPYGQPVTVMTHYRGFHLDEMVTKFLYENDFIANDLSSVKKMKTLHQHCLDIRTTEKFGNIPIPLELNTIGLPIAPPFNLPLNETPDFSKVLAKIHRSPFTKFLFDVDVLGDPKDFTKTRVFFNYSPSIYQLMSDISKGSKMFKIHAPLSETELKMKRARRLLTQVMEVTVKEMNKFTYAPSSKKTNEIIEKRVKEVVDFLVALEEIKELKNPEDGRNLDYTYITLDELQKETNEILGHENGQIQIDWYDYMEELFRDIHNDTYTFFKNGELIGLKNMEQFKAVLRVVSKFSRKVVVSAIWWLVVDSVSPYAKENFRTLHNDYYLQTNNDPSSLEPGHCYKLMKGHFSHLLTHLLIRNEKNVFEERKEVIEMVSNIRAAYFETISQSTWLDAGTKMAALNKLKSMTQSISFSDFMADPEMIDKGYEEIIVNSELFYHNIRSIKLLKRKKQLELLGKENPVAAEGRYLDPLMVNACYAPFANAIDVPIGILGPPYYGLGLQALNYGAIGYILSHEIGHAFDYIGKDFDSSGKKKRWWKKKTVAEYDKRSKCFVDFFDNIYFPEVDKKVNGKLTLGENVADFLGVQQTLKAYKKYVAKHGKEKSLPNFEHVSHEKLLMMAFATINCNETAPPYLLHALETDEHSPDKARVLGVLKNSQEFTDIWKCSSNQEMNPEQKCVMW